MVKLLSGRFGRVIISVTGLKLNSFINGANAKGIALFNISRSSYTTLTAEVSLSDLRRLKRLYSEGYSIKPLRLKGIGARAYSGFRITLAAGLALAVALITVFSSRTWFIRVYGSSNENAVKAALAGAQMLDWHCLLPERAEGARQAVYETDKNILWVGLEYRGATLCAYIKENTALLPEEAAGNSIIASKSGVIRSITVTDGTPLAEAGEAVQAGQTLIEGSVKIGEGVYPVTPQGKIQASVWYYASDELTQNEALIPTGRKSKCRVFYIFGRALTLGDDGGFADYTVSERDIDCGFLPVKIKETTYFEQEINEQFDIEAEVNETAAALKESLTREISENALIIDSKTVTEEQDGVISVGVYIEAIEEIGTLV